MSHNLDQQFSILSVTRREVMRACFLSEEEVSNLTDSDMRVLVNMLSYELEPTKRMALIEAHETIARGITPFTPQERKALLSGFGEEELCSCGTRHSREAFERLLDEIDGLSAKSPQEEYRAFAVHLPASLQTRFKDYGFVKS